MRNKENILQQQQTNGRILKDEKRVFSMEKNVVRWKETRRIATHFEREFGSVKGCQYKITHHNRI